MSWGSGIEIFCKMWPVVKEEMKDDAWRKEFGADLLALFIKHDIDPWDLEGLDPEVDQLIKEC